MLAISIFFILVFCTSGPVNYQLFSSTYESPKRTIKRQLSCKMMFLTNRNRASWRAQWVEVPMCWPNNQSLVPRGQKVARESQFSRIVFRPPCVQRQCTQIQHRAFQDNFRYILSETLSQNITVKVSLCSCTSKTACTLRGYHLYGCAVPTSVTMEENGRHSFRAWSCR